MSIGEKLEEARNKKGISVREAAEATKIRGDFLAAMENDSMDIMLPKIYIRGFIGNYAKFLKLNPNELMADYDALNLDESEASDQNRLGQINLPDIETKNEISDVVEEEDIQPNEINEILSWMPTDKTFYYKLALLLGGGVVLVFLLGLLIQFIFPADEHEINPELAESNGDVAPAAAYVQLLEEETIILLALNDVNVIVDQLIDQERLFSGTLRKNESIELIKIGKVQITFNEGENLVVEKGGQNFEMDVTGPGTRFLK